MSLDKKSRDGSERQQRRNDSGSDSSLERKPVKSRRRRGSESDASDGSPVKRSVASKVERSGADRRERDRSSPDLMRSPDAGRAMRSPDAVRSDKRGSSVGGRSNSRSIASPRSAGGRRDLGNRSLSPPEKRNNSGRNTSFDSAGGVKYLDHRTKGNTRFQGGRGRGGERRPFGRSPDDRNFGRGDYGRLNDPGGRFNDPGPPPERNWQDPPLRGNRSFEREPDRYQIRDRPIRMRSQSPNDRGALDTRVLTYDREIDIGSQRSRSPESRRSRLSNRKSRSLSPSPEKSLSPEPQKQKKTKKAASKNQKALSEDRLSKSKQMVSGSDVELDRKTSKKAKLKEKKKKAASEADDTLESSFERSKKFLVSHSDEFDIPEPEETELLSPPPVKVKTKSKRQRDSSDSGSESPKKTKKSKEQIPDDEPVVKKIKKTKKDNKESKRDRLESLSPEKPKSLNSKKSKGKKANRKSFSKSPNVMDRSRSSDASLGRHHDLAQFESEPESGEITDSDEEGRQAMKSMISVVS